MEVHIPGAGLRKNNEISLHIPSAPSPSFEVLKEKDDKRHIVDALKTEVHWAHSSIVMAMLTGNTMRNCDEVRKMYQECERTGADDQLCQVARQYYELCLQGEELYSE